MHFGVGSQKHDTILIKTPKWTNSDTAGAKALAFSVDLNYHLLSGNRVVMKFPSNKR